MKNITRRDFFRQLTDSVSDTVDTEKLKAVFHEAAPVPSWRRIVALSEMAPGIVYPFEFGGVRGVLHSNEFGLYAQLEAGRYAALRATPQGILEINLTEAWVHGQILSHATGTVIFSEINEERL